MQRPISTIESLDDPRLDPYRDLKSSNLTRWSGRFIAEGAEVVRRLLASRLETESVLVKSSAIGRWKEAVPEDVPLLSIEDRLSEDLAGFNFHQGVLACGIRPENQGLERWTVRSDEPRRLAALDRVTDPDNLGSVIRLARAFGLTGLLLGRGCPDPWSRRVVRVSMGNVYEVPVRQTASVGDDLERLAESGVRVVATALAQDAIPLGQFESPEEFCLVLGNERHGISHDILERCSDRVRIPMQAGADSLNVAIAAGIVLYGLTGDAAGGTAND